MLFSTLRFGGGFVSLLSLFVLMTACAEEEPPAAAPAPAQGKEDYEYVNWGHYLGDPGVSHHSLLDQISTENVGQLEVAWSYSTGDGSDEGRSQIQCNPLIIDGILYGTSAQLRAFALDAETGEEIWTFDLFEGEYSFYGWGVNRGLAFWTDGQEKRILYTVGYYLFALDATTGTLIPEFGSDGRVDLRRDLDIKGHFWQALSDIFGNFPNIKRRDIKRLFIDDRFVIATSPGVIYEDLFILGSRVTETKGAAPGHIRAFNVRTGEIEWIFHTIPQPGEFGYETWPEDAWETAGGANSWAGMSIDTSRGVVYIPTGSATFDYYGGDRRGENLFANSLIALDAATGERVWHFQTVHHDLWDRDLPAPPNLLTLEREGKKVEAVAQITKTGFVFVFDRDTGEPLFPVEETPVPPSRLKGEEAWPSQPIPVRPPPFARQRFEESDITRRTPEAYEYVKSRWEQLEKGQLFIPPSVEGTIVFPGIDGGGEWGGAAVDTSGVLYVNASEMPFIMKAIPNFQGQGEEVMAVKGKLLYNTYCITCHGEDLKGTASFSSPGLIGVQEKLEKEEIKTIITEGRGAMPYFQNLSDSEVEDVVAYISNPDQAPTQASLEEGEKAAADPSMMPYTVTGYNRFYDQDGFPAITPPWGTLTALDLNEGTIRWKIPLGHHPGLPPAQGEPSGCENYGGPIVTTGNVLFIAATMDEKMRAFDKRDGSLLWETELPAAGYATPATYAINGKQYVVIACGGGKLDTRSGDTYISFALPDSLQ